MTGRFNRRSDLYTLVQCYVSVYGLIKRLLCCYCHRSSSLRQLLFMYFMFHSFALISLKQIQIHISTHIYTFHTCIHTCVHKYMNKCMQTYIHKNLYMYACMVCVFIFAHLHLSQETSPWQRDRK